MNLPQISSLDSFKLKFSLGILQFEHTKTDKHSKVQSRDTKQWRSCKSSSAAGLQQVQQ